jgi:galactokinase
MVMERHLPPRLSKAKMTPNVAVLVEKAKALYQDKLAYFAQNHKPPAFIVAAPGRVNLIGEHTDYTGGFVLPLAINLSTVVYGTGFVKIVAQAKTPTSIRLRMYSDQSPNDLVEERRLTGFYPPPEKPNPEDENPGPGPTWADYVVGTIVQYMPDLPTEGCHLDLVMAFASDIPLGAGLSSSASLEMATAVFLENFMHDYAYSSASLVPDGTLQGSKSKLDISPEDEEKQTKIERALRCQKAENEWAHSVCGIMDQMISSCAVEGNLLLLDCRDLEYTLVPLKQTNTTNPPVLVITNSNVEHKLAGEDSQYAQRRNQCQDALLAMQSVPLYHVLSLRDATLQDVKDGKERGKGMDEVAYKRAKHVVTENARTKEAKVALRLGTWDRLGELMNASHDSLRDDFEVSTEEVDFLVETARAHPGVFGSRITGGGFGGCIVSLVLKDSADSLMEKLSTAYAEKYNGKTCPSIIVDKPGPGARVLAIDMDCKPESDFYKSSPKKNKNKDKEEQE